MAATLSQTLRRAAVQEAAQSGGAGATFSQSAPVGNPQSVVSGIADGDLRGTSRQIVLEIHEDAVADLPTWRKLRHATARHRHAGCLMTTSAAGQARYLELADSPPEFLKLDMKLIRDIHLNRSRQQLVQALIAASNNLGVSVIAEGVESVRRRGRLPQPRLSLRPGILLCPPSGCRIFSPRAGVPMRNQESGIRGQT